MRRRTFIAAGSALGLGVLIAGLKQLFEKTSQKIHAKITSPDYKTGHLLRDGKLPETAAETRKCKVVIIGGGIAGMAAAWHLKSQGFEDFELLELENETGGNSGQTLSSTGPCPIGAHYLPLPDPNNHDLIAFLKDSNVVTGFDKGLPVYNEYMICQDNEENLHIKGIWQQDIIPKYGTGDGSKKQTNRFLNLMQEYRNATGTDGKNAFNIPIAESSADEQYRKLDLLSMAQWLQQQGFDDPHLLWYVNYCCLDDFGAGADLVSAWAGIHYFASRRGNAANAKQGNVLTWPEGNGYLAGRLKRRLQPHLKTGMMCSSLKTHQNGNLLEVYDKNAQQLIAYETSAVILAVPAFVRQRLLKQAPDHRYVYHPWLVSNMVMKPEFFEIRKPAWDNVLYDGNSLGYVFAGHQETELPVRNRTITFYKPFGTADVAENRTMLLKADSTALAKICEQDMLEMHPNFQELLESQQIHVWGHGMIRPSVDFIWNEDRHSSLKPTGRLAMAHTDMSGISIFEEGFYRGIEAARHILKQLQA